MDDTHVRAEDKGDISLVIKITSRKSIQSPTHKRPGWLVDIHIEGQEAFRQLSVFDPLDKNETECCQWYLEQYVQQSPYSVDKAGEVAQLLTEYPASIVEQLQLNNMVSSCFKHEGGRRRLFLEIIDDETHGQSGSTIHRLYWELLEDPEPWNIGEVEITARRTIPTSPTPPRSRSPTLQTGSGYVINNDTSQLNVLVVVARDISRNPAVYNDVDPTLASGILIKIKKALQKVAHAVKLNVEIVRPGTFDALERHLDRAEKLHGKGYYHILHLDMHGRVGTRKGLAQKFGFLWFNDPASDGLKACTARRVAKLVGRHHVPVVVLNACESARASYGDDANIAKTFVGEGILKVLAMTFKISSHSAYILLVSFYHRLLIDRSSFPAAVSAGRAALRASSSRFARFDLQRELLDWFVPVTYGSGDELLFADSQADIGKRPVNISALEEWKGVKTHNESFMRNRDFDVLRLEKVLVQRRKAYVYGPQGVGKTAFLKYVSSLWKETGFVDAAVSINFETDNISSSEEFTNLLLRLLLEACGEEADTARLPISSPLPMPSYNQDLILDKICTIISTFQVLIIMDGVHASHSSFGSTYVPGSLSNTVKSDISADLNLIIDTVASNNRHQGIFLICSDRDADIRNVESQLGIELKGSEFELCGLSLPDSLEVAQSLLKISGEDVDRWEQEDYDLLDFVVSALQGIPGALEEILPLAKLLDIPWRDFFKHLRTGLVSDPIAFKSIILDGGSIFQELCHLSSAAPEVFSRLVIISLFWHEGPFVSSLSLESGVPLSVQDAFDLSATQVVTSHAADFMQIAVALGVDRGYLRLGQSSTISWIHPLFTIYGRPFAISNSLKPLSIAADNRHGAVAFPSEVRLLDAMVVNLLQEIYVVSFISDTSEGVGYEDMVSRHGSRQLNLLTCMDMCTQDDSALPLDLWPTTLFSMEMPFINILLTTIKERRLFSESVYALLNAFFKLNGSTAVDPAHQHFIFSAFFYLAHTFIYLIPLSDERVDRLCQLWLDVLASSEEPNNDFSGFAPVLVRLQTAGVFSLWLFSKNRDAEARTMLDMVIALEDTLRCLADNLPGDGITNGAMPLGGDPIWQSMSRQCAKQGTAFEEIKRFHAERHISPMIKDMMDTFRNKDVVAVEDFSSNFEIQKEILRRSNSVLEAIGINGISRASEFWPENFDMRGFRKYDTALQRLRALEEAQDRGNWMDAIKHHRTLSRNAWEDFDIDEAIEHLDALEVLYGKLQIFDKELEDLRSERQSMKEYSSMMKVVTSMLGSAQNFAGIVEKSAPVLGYLEKSGMPPGYIQTLQNIQQVVPVMQPEHGPTNAKPNKALIRRIMRKYMEKSKSSTPENDFLKNNMRFSECYLKLVTSWDGDDLEEIERVLEEFCELAQDSLVEDILIAQGQGNMVSDLRAAFTHRRVVISTIEEWAEALDTNAYDQAQACLSRLVSYIDSNKVPFEDGKMEQIQKVTSQAHWEYYKDRLREASTSAEHTDEFENLCAEVLHKWENKEFLDVPESQIVPIRFMRLSALMNRAIKQNDWQKIFTLNQELSKLSL